MGPLYTLYVYIRRGRVILLLLVSLVFNRSQRNISNQNLEKVLVLGDPGAWGSVVIKALPY